MLCSAFLISIAIAGSVEGMVLEEDKKPVHVSAHVGGSAVFSCDMDFPHDFITPYILNWNKEGEKVFSVKDGVLSSAEEGFAGRVSVEVVGGKAKINLTSIREPDHGWYECRLYFPNRTPTTRLNGTWFHLTVQGSDLMGIPPMNQTVVKGEEARLECVTKDEEARVTWYKNEIPLSSITELQSRAWIEPQGSLTIKDTDINDPGLYKCEVVSKAGLTQSATAFLNVHYKARVVYTEREVFLPFGRPGVLDCHVNANPPVTILRWEKDGFLFDPYNVPGVFSRRNGSLYFNKVEESHGGDYTCTPYNELGTEGPSSPIKLIVQHPPYFTVTPHNLYLRNVGETITMPCDALDGDQAHRPTIVWFKKDGSQLPPDRAVIIGGNLTISNIKETDRGLYQCVASNEAATITTDTELLIENSVPRGPYNLTGDVNHTSVSITWKPGLGVVNPHYSVWMRPIDSPLWRTVPATGMQATISSLEPGKEYIFIVLSQDRNGGGMFSKPIVLRTKGTPLNEAQSTSGLLQTPEGIPQPVTPPSNLKIAATVEGYRLDWNEPEEGGGEVDHYEIFWTQMPPDSDHLSLPIVVETSETSYLVGDLEEGSMYHFQVKAITSSGMQSGSNTFIFHVPTYHKAEMFSLLVAGTIGFIVAFIVVCLYTNRVYVRNQIGSFKSRRPTI